MVEIKFNFSIFIKKIVIILRVLFLSESEVLYFMKYFTRSKLIKLADKADLDITIRDKEKTFDNSCWEGNKANKKE